MLYNVVLLLYSEVSQHVYTYVPFFLSLTFHPYPYPTSLSHPRALNWAPCITQHNLYRKAKAKGIEHHQTSFTTNAKETSVDEKHKRRKRPTEAKFYQCY